MNKMAVNYLSVFAVILFSVTIFLSSVVNFYQIQVDNEAAKNSAWLQVEKDYQYRAGLISNLFALIQNAKLYENKAFNGNHFLSELAEVNNVVSLHVTQLLKKQLNRSEKQSLIKQYIEKQTTISQLLNTILVSDYFHYELKSSAQLSPLLKEIARIEDNIKINQLLYQQTLEQYEVDLRRFPSSEIGRLQVLSEKIEFDQEVEPESLPHVATVNVNSSIQIN